MIFFEFNFRRSIGDLQVENQLVDPQFIFYYRML